jgi:Smg protein
MMDILMYLFETYIHSESELVINQEELEEELLKAGFRKQEIYKALTWLEELAALQQEDAAQGIATSAASSTRIFTEQESHRLNAESRGFLLLLEQAGVLMPETRELVIDRVMGIDIEEFSLEELKWVVLMVLFNSPGNENAYMQMEELLYSKEQGLLH